MVLSFPKRTIGELILFKEKKEAQLYRERSEQIEDTRTAEVFRMLADRAEEYQCDLEDWCAQLGGCGFREEYPGQHLRYVEDQVNRHAFHQAFISQVQKVGSTKDALEVAIHFERNFNSFLRSFEQFLSMKDRGVLQEALHKEKKHLSSITNLRQQYI